MNPKPNQTQKANPKSTVTPKVHCLNFGNTHCIQVFHTCRVYQANCGI